MNTGLVASIGSCGPGIWWVIHTEALKATNRLKQNIFKELLISMIESLPCPNCVNHGLEYVSSTAPIDSFVMKSTENVDAQYSMFKYTVDFHNSVRIRQSKSTVTLINAYKFYVTKIKYGSYPETPFIEVVVVPPKPLPEKNQPNKRVTTLDTKRTPTLQQLPRIKYEMK